MVRAFILKKVLLLEKLYIKLKLKGFKLKISSIPQKGYTLIEIIISLALIAILVSFSTTMLIGYKRYLNRANIDYCNNSIMFFVNKSKQYCRTKGLKGMIYFDYINHSLIFTASEKKIDTFSLPAGFQLCQVTLSTGKFNLTIDKNGITSDACTISYEDIEGKKHKITICVGTAFVEIKDP